MAEVFVDGTAPLRAGGKQASFPSARGRKISACVSRTIPHFEPLPFCQDRPVTDIAFCGAAYANGVRDDRIEGALEDDFLAPDISPSRRAAYIRRTMDKARKWIEQ